MNRTRVLIVDDEPQITKLIQKFLERTGRYDVRVENHGARATDAALEFRPEIIVLDVCMPDMDGNDVAHAMEQIPELRGIPVFFLTGLVGPDEVGPDGWEAGARVYLPKPIRMTDLLHRLELASA